MLRLAKRIKDMPIRQKAQLIAAMVITLLVIITIPSLAWFSSQRQVATVAKINSPALLYVYAGKAEDIIQLKLTDINVGDGMGSGSEQFVFCVYGEDVPSYNLQIARTTNLKFNYTLYRAHTDASVSIKDSNHAEYTAIDGTKVFYVKAENLMLTNGTYINADGTTVSGRTIGTTGYITKSYDNSDLRQYFAEPLYWQTITPIDSKDIDDGVSYDEYESVFGETNDKKFLNFYILEVSWAAGSVSNDKETDIIYITAEVE